MCKVGDITNKNSECYLAIQLIMLLLLIDGQTSSFKRLGQPHTKASRMRCFLFFYLDI